jgi:hypothetical protein
MLLFDRKYTKETKDPKVSAKSVLSVFICGVFIFQPIPEMNFSCWPHLGSNKSHKKTC